MSADPPLGIQDWLVAVVQDEAEKTTTPLLVVTASQRTCFPHAFFLDTDARTVKCSRCDREFLPFDALLNMTRAWPNYAANLAELRQDVARLTKLRTALRRDVQSLKAKAKRAAGAQVVADAALGVARPHPRRLRRRTA